jgi:hypothetical protein
VRGRECGVISQKTASVEQDLRARPKGAAARIRARPTPAGQLKTLRALRRWEKQQS